MRDVCGARRVEVRVEVRWVGVEGVGEGGRGSAPARIISWWGRELSGVVGEV